ncbi:AI-2E family transporter [Lactobacillus hominis]|uniref:Permease n=1 Tax=Lactobacillus hominis DSM 23910 = CRBIP 24.179 TaxID=1423758 RepID=I7L9S8_9LACO|nr:AI-2E family transporter [Lactobacillus hominis]KRM84951.1 permease [Lactobacillus hominis DSM 23910 = CRBIP 24.179]MCT3348148.1 AI-2E family transporter [Lactobacillus hominis]CCI81649.1 Permease [Lactobacillus hominis DSM 23910 = CRBIP 24.179]
MQKVWQNFKQNIPLRRFVVLMLLIFVLYEARSMMNTILLTFIFTYLIVHLINFVKKHIPKVPSQIIVAVTYLLLVALLYFGITIYMPVLIKQSIKVVDSVVKFYQSNDMDGVMSYVNQYVSKGEITTQVKKGMGIAIHALTGFGSVTVAFFMSLILSFFYTIELKQMHEFSQSFLKTGYLTWLFEDIHYFGKKFVNTFGVVLEAQFFIAICNTVLTMICLIVMKMPQIIALGLMVFILSLIPVAGVIISLIPLSIVAYTVGGIQYVIYIFIIIMIIHAIEAYILNPKFMSSKTELPIFYTFVVLLVGEHFWGIWGLIVGVPIFTFLLDILDIKPLKKKALDLKQLKLKRDTKKGRD